MKTKKPKNNKNSKNHIDKYGTMIYRKSWRKVKLGDLLEVKHGYSFKGENITAEPTNNILVTPGNFNIGGGFKSSKFKYFNNDVSKDYILKRDDLIITMTDLSKDSDTLGYSAKVPASKKNEVYLHNQRIGFIQFKTNSADKDFIYWLMRTWDYHWFIVSSSSGTSIRHTSPKRIKEYEFYLPPLSEQKAIAEVLSSLDDKIELLHKQNQTLENIAQTLFRKWFIEDAKDSWKKGRLGDFLETIESGSRPKGGIDSNLRKGVPSIGAESINGVGKFDFSKTKYVSGDFFKNMKKGIIKDYDVLIYKDGAYIGKKAMFGQGFPFKKMSVNEHIFILRANSKTNQFFIYFLLNQKELVKLNANSAQPGLNQQAMKSLKIVMPPKNKMDKFGNITKPWIEKILSNSNQIRELEKTRKILLPKLMNGTIKINL